MIVCCGEALIDMVPGRDGPDSFVAKPGGCPFNTAIAAARLGASVEFLGRLGTDLFGEQLAAALAADGVGLGRAARGPEPATLAFVRRDGRGNASYAFYSRGAADVSLAGADLPAALGPGASFLAIGSISLLQEPSGSAIEAFAAREAGRGTLVSLDPNVRPGLVVDREAYRARLERLIRVSAIVKASDDDLAWLYPGLGAEEAARRVLGMGPALVALTQGAEGALALGPSGSARVRAREVAVADTIGAGDSFHAALLVRLEASGIRGRSALAALGHGELRAALEYAAAAAALDCSRPGADPPRAAELEDFLRGLPPAPQS